MESETPPPPPTALEARISQLTPSSIHAAWSDDEPLEPAAYLAAHSSNSNLPHNNILRVLSLHIQALGSRIIMRGMNDLRMYDRHKLVLATHRPPTQALLTLSNNQSTVDDPGLLSNLAPYSVHTSLSASRWSWCAREMCFGTSLGGWAMRHGKIVPIVRGLGLYQEGFREAEDHLRAGHWMHVFPEGKCIPISRGIGALKWGSGKLMVDAIRRSQACRESRRMHREASEALEHDKATRNASAMETADHDRACGAASTHHSTTAAASTAAAASAVHAAAIAPATAASAAPAAAAADSSVSPFARLPPIAPGASFSSALRTALRHPAFASSPSAAAAAASASAATAAAARASLPCPDPPLVIPIVHHGMPRVMPFYHLFPRVGKTVRVIVGDPIDVSAMVSAHDSAGNEANRLMFQYPLEEDLLVAVTKRIAGELRALDERLCDIEAQEGDPQPELPKRPYGRGIGPDHQ